MGIVVTALSAMGVLVCLINPVWAACSYVIAIIFRANEHVDGVKFPVLPAMIVIMGIAYMVHLNRKLPYPKQAKLKGTLLILVMMTLLLGHLLIWHRELLLPWILGEFAPLVLLVLFASRFMTSMSRVEAMFTSAGIGSMLIGGQAFLVHFLFKQRLTMFKDQFGDMLVTHGKLWDDFHLYGERDMPEAYSARLKGRGDNTWGNSNDLGMVCNWGIPVGIYYFRRKGSKILKLLGGGLALMLAGTLFLTGSRGNQLQMGIYLWMIFIGGKRKALGIVLLVIAVAGALVVLPKLMPQRSDSAASSDERTMLLKDAMRMFIHNPIKGVGFNNFQDLAFKTLMPHNVYAQCLAETGLLGAAIFFPMLFFLRRDTARSVKYLNNTDQYNLALLSRCIGGLQFAYLVFMLFTNQFMRFTFGLVMSLSIALYIATERFKETQEQGGEGTQPDQGDARPEPTSPRLAAREIIEEAPPYQAALPARAPLELEAHREPEGARYVFDPDAPDQGVQYDDSGSIAQDELDDDLDDALDGEWPPRRPRGRRR